MLRCTWHLSSQFPQGLKQRTCFPLWSHYWTSFNKPLSVSTFLNQYFTSPSDCWCCETSERGPASSPGLRGLAHGFFGQMEMNNSHSHLFLARWFLSPNRHELVGRWSLHPVFLLMQSYPEYLYQNEIDCTNRSLWAFSALFLSIYNSLLSHSLPSPMISPSHSNDRQFVCKLRLEISSCRDVNPHTDTAGWGCELAQRGNVWDLYGLISEYTNLAAPLCQI